MNNFIVLLWYLYGFDGFCIHASVYLIPIQEQLMILSCVVSQIRENPFYQQFYAAFKTNGNPNSSLVTDDIDLLLDPHLECLHTKRP